MRDKTTWLRLKSTRKTRGVTVQVMPNIKSAAKRLKQATAARIRNRSTKRTVHTQVTKVLTVLESGKLEEAQAEFRLAAKKLDQAAAKRVIHKNAAARSKSRLAKRLKAAKKA